MAPGWAFHGSTKECSRPEQFIVKIEGKPTAIKEQFKSGRLIVLSSEFSLVLQKFVEMHEMM